MVTHTSPSPILFTKHEYVTTKPPLILIFRDYVENKKVEHYDTAQLEYHNPRSLTWVAENCLDNIELILHTTLDDTVPVEDLVSITFDRNRKQGMCFKRTDLFAMIASDRDLPLNNSSTSNPAPIYFMANWLFPILTTNLPKNGKGGYPGCRIFVKMPNLNYITLKSLYRIIKEKDIKKWIALPLYDGKPVRIGNLLGNEDISSNHGQIEKQQKIYKLYSTNEDISDVKEDDNEYLFIKKRFWKENNILKRGKSLKQYIESVQKNEYSSAVPEWIQGIILYMEYALTQGELFDKGTVDINVDPLKRGT